MTDLKTEYLSTGKTAALCSVTASTVLKWIKAGKIQAVRTAGGHYRIPKYIVDSVMGSVSIDGLSTVKSVEEKPKKPFQYCWEFKAKSDEIGDGCKNCVVYKARVGRCFEVSNLPQDVGHAHVFCDESCDECDYYKMLINQRPNILVVTDQPQLKESFEQRTPGSGYNLRFTDCEYKCSMLVDDYRPDYVVIDCAMGTDRSRDFAKNLLADPRIPYVRVILTGKRSEFPKKCDQLVFAFIEHPFTADEIEDLIVNLRFQDGN